MEKKDHGVKYLNKIEKSFSPFLSKAIDKLEKLREKHMNTLNEAEMDAIQELEDALVNLHFLIENREE